MSKMLQHIVNHLKAEGKDYTNFSVLLAAINSSGYNITKNEVLNFVINDSRIQLQTTPNSIAKLITYLSQQFRPKSAIDICCGTGNILYYLHNEIDNITGVEVVENVAELTKYFLLDTKIIVGDSFKYSFTEKYDLVVGNIPYGLRVEIDGKRIYGEEAFLRKAFDLLSESGHAIMLVPSIVLNINRFSHFREAFVPFIREVISIPSGIIRNTQIKTALVVFGKRKNDNVVFSQLQHYENLIREYQANTKVTVSKTQFIERWDPEYHLARDNSFFKELENYKTSELRELAEITRGKMFSSDLLKNEGDLLYLKPVHIKQNSLSAEKELKFVRKNILSEIDYRYILQPGDIVIDTAFTTPFNMYVYQPDDIPAIASSLVTIIRSAKQDYIASYFQTDEGKHIFKRQAKDLTAGAFVPSLPISVIARIKIPILPLAELNILGNKNIQKATASQLEEALELLSQYKLEIETLNQGNFNSLKTFLDDRLNRVEVELKKINLKLNQLLVLLNELKLDFDHIRSLPRKNEEKLFKLCQKIDAKLDAVYDSEPATIEGYIEEIKRWLDLWEMLDMQSQKFLPIAEYIFDQLCKMNDADYAPFVVQYCRTLENEILKKLFEEYHRNGLNEVDRDELVGGELDNQKTGKFAQMVKRNKTTYTLGDMNFIMALLKKGGKTLAESSLLQHFRNHTISYFDEKILEKEFLTDVNKLTSEFRNKAAHPYSISVDLAKQCQDLLRKSLNVFLESIKNKT